eukprot:CAMPEP_0118680904 /NCGR_PEP_ID=MMETSP0800-20121206/4635_1 /TAXON_ID=210618 ORGANISM="Striatella unipunctata, Strain CCMP2910" /NCGR_SAMPLE_ID=MMETSP0800 /ASSEMBLY_ACC=CAM_ASM_000638 /LENGTH=340 /DNA_ID=CAMNT_0006577127 /DNA_START=229 /DNA_END=1251 /DNA_ORIENTATION=-
MMKYHMEMENGLEVARADFGGPDGHVFEGSFDTIEDFRGTRCSSTVSAITAYFCGNVVAENKDLGLGNRRKPQYFGVESFSNFVRCRHKQGEAKKVHRRSVYRLGIGCKDNLAGYSHAFSIVAQPDGSFHWYQSYISHYSLITWMEKKAPDGNPYGQLSLSELLERLDRVDRLMKIDGWNDQANKDYLDLFGVDKNKEAMRRSGRSVELTWKPSHRLGSFQWDEACEYPVAVGTDAGATSATGAAGDNDDNSASSDYGENSDKSQNVAVDSEVEKDKVEENDQSQNNKDDDNDDGVPSSTSDNNFEKVGDECIAAAWSKTLVTALAEISDESVAKMMTQR